MKASTTMAILVHVITSSIHTNTVISLTTLYHYAILLEGRGGNDSNSDSDDESFGNAEVEVDHYGDKDIGKLMRYLTRRDLARKEKEEREKAEQEQKEKEEREKAAFVADLLKGRRQIFNIFLNH